MGEQSALILESAVEVFAARGYRRTSIDAVAERAGLTRQGVLHYFPSKKQLLLAVLDYREELTRGHIGPPEATLDLPTAFADAIAYEQAHPHMAQVAAVVMAEAATGLEPCCGYVRERRKLREVGLAAFLSERYGERVPSGMTPDTAAIALVALIEGIHLQWLADPDRDEDHYPNVIGEAVRALLDTPGGKATNPAGTDTPG